MTINEVLPTIRLLSPQEKGDLMRRLASDINHYALSFPLENEANEELRTLDYRFPTERKPGALPGTFYQRIRRHQELMRAMGVQGPTTPEGIEHINRVIAGEI